MKIMKFTNSFSKDIERLRKELSDCRYLIIGAGAGLSASAGFDYSGARFQKYFGDFIEKHGFTDMYSGGFYPFKTPEEKWAYWSRYIYINRYMPAPKPVYENLLELVKDKDYFVLTTNVDHQFQKAGIDKNRLFYTQGDYGLFQCSEPCHPATYDNEEIIRKMVQAQGFAIAEDGTLELRDGVAPKMAVPAELAPHCPKCGKPMSMNLRGDDTFAEDEGWHEAATRYDNFLDKCQDAHVLYLELGVGMNTPGIIKFPFWQMTHNNPQAIYACLNFGQAIAPREIAPQSICLQGDIGDMLESLKASR